jgi:hypothetical protein
VNCAPPIIGTALDQGSEILEARDEVEVPSFATRRGVRRRGRACRRHRRGSGRFHSGRSRADQRAADNAIVKRDVQSDASVTGRFQTPCGAVERLVLGRSFFHG